VKDSSHNRFRKILAASTVLLLILHVAIASYLTFSGNNSRSNILLRSYHRFALIGPFFREETITSTPRFIVTSWKNGKPESIEIFQALTREYHHRPWSTSTLVYRDYIRKSIPYRKSDIEKQTLKKIVKITAPYTIDDADSIQWMYMYQRFSSGDQLIRDTVFTYSFNPSEIAPD
jgi:hypothetical protein